MKHRKSLSAEDAPENTGISEQIQKKKIFGVSAEIQKYFRGLFRNVFGVSSEIQGFFSLFIQKSGNSQKHIWNFCRNSETFFRKNAEIRSAISAFFEKMSNFFVMKILKTPEK